MNNGHESQKNAVLYDLESMHYSKSCYYCSRSNTTVCSNCSHPRDAADAARLNILRKLTSSTCSLKNLDETFIMTGACCEKEKTVIHGWRQSVEDAIKEIGSFRACCKM